MKYIATEIVHAFANVEYPGDWCLRESDEGLEPFAVERAFRGKDDWRSLDHDFLDGAPDGLGSALSFFSDEAFRFYIPAYLIAYLSGSLQRSDPIFAMTHGLGDRDHKERINERRYGERTWGDAATYKHSIFDCKQVKAIVLFLQHCCLIEEVYEAAQIQQALDRYWLPRYAELAQQGN